MNYILGSSSKKWVAVAAFLSVCFLLPDPVSAQDTDSLSVETLQEVNVQAKLQKTSAGTSVFIPSLKQKSSAQNALDLLHHLAIPEISIDLVDDKVTTRTGAAVSLFINYLPASRDDLDALQPTDVRRVEYLDFPVDPRFQGAEHVILFMVHKYTYGGYSKLSVKEDFLTGLSSDVSLFSRLVHKKMIYDLYAGASHQDLRHNGSSTTGVYSLLDDNGGTKTLTRSERFDDAHYREAAYPVTFRAIYDDDRITVSNTVGFPYDANPIATYSGTLSYDPAFKDGQYRFTMDNPSRQKFVTWGGNYYFSLPKGFSMSLSPFAEYQRTNDDTLYSSGLPDSDVIENKAEEDLYRYGISVFLDKNLSDRQSIFFSGYYGANKSNVRYRGTSPYDNHFLDQYAGITVGYNISDGNRLNINANTSLQWEENRINDQSVRKLYPLVNLSAGFSPSSKHSFRTFFHYGANYPGQSVKTPNVLQQNELMYITGNPDIGLSRQFNCELSYNWIPDNNFSSSLFASYFGELNLYVPVFAYYNDGKALLRKYDVDARYHRFRIGASLNYKMLDGKLQIAWSPSVTIYRMLGYYDLYKAPFYCNASATYYCGDFYFQTAYQTKFRTIQGNRAVYYEDRDFWQLRAGWSKNNLNIRLTARNLFHNDWRTSVETLDSPLYSEVRYSEGINFHQRINLSITYTLNYGKKVTKRGNEVGEQYGSSSAILR